MRIIFIAKHDSGGNDDEGAVYHALTSLGHDVQRLNEPRGYKFKRLLPADLVLFFKWHDLDVLRTIEIPKVFWYFDLVEWHETPGRSAARVAWMREVTPLVDIGFCTDGDWVAKNPEKLVWLPQGADERVVGRGVAEVKCATCGVASVQDPIDILFTGIGKGGGATRESFVAEMQLQYGKRFRHVPHGVHGSAMADLIARSKIVVAPDSPVTDRYWSNRVYNALGFGAMLLHPQCHGLLSQYTRQELQTYASREQLHDQIEHYLYAAPARYNHQEAGLARTLREHLYRHRCEELIRVVKERLGI